MEGFRQEGKMNRLRFLSLIGLAVLVMVAWSFPVSAAPLEDLVAGAKKEGALNLHAPSALGPQGAKELGVAFSKKYALNVQFNYIPSSSFTADVAKVISHAAIGVPSEWDLSLITDNHHATLWRRRLHLPFDYRVLGVDPRSIQHDNGSVMIAHGVTLPGYNNKTLLPKDVPGRWEDLLDPRWKDGKLGVSSATHHFARLAAGPWGEKKTTEFVRGLARQRPFLGRLAELSTRLQLGEVLIAGTLSSDMIHNATKKGAPLAHAAKVEPVLMLGYNAGVLKGARHPNTAHLFAAFMATSEAQEIWEKHRGESSVFVPGTRSYEFAKGKQILLMRPEDAELVDRLANDYSKLLGFVTN